MALGCCVIADAAEDAPHYVVLGDSIAFGSGLSNPRQAVYGRIVADTNGYAYDNFAVPGHTTQNLLQRMQNEQVKAAIADADIISISIGGNNFLLGNLNALLATTTVSLIAYVTATLLGTHPFYEHLSVRLLGTIESGDNDVAEKGTMVARTFQVGIGSLVESRTIQEIHWPKDMIVVSISRAGNESIANGQTRIEALDTLTILMNAEQEESIARQVASMCEAQT